MQWYDQGSGHDREGSMSIIGVYGFGLGIKCAYSTVGLNK